MQDLSEARKIVGEGCDIWPRLVDAAGTVCESPESTITDLLACMRHRGLPRGFAAMTLSKRTRRLEQPLSLDPDEWRAYLKSRALLPAETIRKAFAEFEHSTSAVLDVVDQVFMAALQCRELEFKPTEPTGVSVTVDGLESFAVRLPHDTLSMFRIILARVGAICGYAEGILQGEGELKRKHIEYVRAASRPEPGAPLYLVNADLRVRTGDGQRTLHVQMSNNNSQPLFLKISRSTVTP